jgi:hypothetical protein
LAAADGSRGRATEIDMQDDGGDRRKGGIKGDQNRKERLAEELRANLLRRKARARRIAAAGARPSPSAHPDDATGKGCNGIPVVQREPICDSNPRSGQS